MGATFELHEPPQEISSRILHVEETLDQQSLSASHTFCHTRLHFGKREKPVSSFGNCPGHRHTIHPIVSLPLEKCSRVSRSLEAFGKYPLSRGQNMRTRRIRLAILPFQGFLVYLFSANILAQTGVVNLPLSYGTIGAQGFAIQITLLTLQLLVVLAMSILIKRPEAQGLSPKQTE